MTAEYVAEAVVPEVTRQRVVKLGGISTSGLADQLDEHGVVRLRDVVSDDWLAAMRDMVIDRIAARGDGDLFIEHADRESGSPADELMSDPALRQLLDGVARHRRPGAGPAQKFQCNISVRNGVAPKIRANLFHYDPSVLTVVVPIFIPHATVGRCGELAAFGNKRPFRRFVATHLIDTVLTHNSLFRRHLVKNVDSAPHNYIVEMRPGDAYVFWGYRQFHGNLACDPGLLRATLVVSFGEVHSDSMALKLAWRFSRSRRDIGRVQCSPATPS